LQDHGGHRALTIIKAQKELFLMERSSLEKQISELKASGYNIEEAQRLTGRLIETQGRINASDAAIAAWNACLKTATDQAALAACRGTIESSIVIPKETPR
jgi:hypothetical protein